MRAKANNVSSYHPISKVNDQENNHQSQAPKFKIVPRHHQKDESKEKHQKKIIDGDEEISKSSQLFAWQLTF